MLNRFSLGMAIFMFAAFAFQVSAQIQPTSSGSVSVANQVNFSVFVTLYKDERQFAQPNFVLTAHPIMLLGMMCP